MRNRSLLHNGLTVFRNSHTSFVVESCDKSLAIDPVLGRGVVDTFGVSVGGIVLSHAHTDHFDISTLWFVDRKIPIYIPKGDDLIPYGMKSELVLLGFVNVFEVGCWESFEVGHIAVTFVPVPCSFEGTVQVAVIVEAGGFVFFNGVDCLECEEVFSEVASKYSIDIAALPVNCSFMFNSVRNQMSPSSAIRAVRKLKPRLVFPTGVLSKPFNSKATSYSPFPLSDEDSIIRFINEHVGSRTKCFSFPEFSIVKLPYCGSLVEKFDSDNSFDVDRCRSIISLFFCKSRRNELLFGMPRYLEFAVWKKRWEDLEFRSETDIESILLAIPVELLGIPVSRYFPFSISYIYQNYRSDYAPLLVASLDLVAVHHEEDYVSQCRCLLADFDEVVRVLSLIEFCAWMQLESARSRPRLPKAISAKEARSHAERQLSRDLVDPSLIYPRIKAGFCCVPMSYEVYKILSLPIDPIGIKLPVVKVVGDKANLHLRNLSIHEQLFISVILEAKGRLSVKDICNKMKWSVDLFFSLCLTFVKEAPDMIEFHNIPDL